MLAQDTVGEPCVLLFEDLHWADKASLDVIVKKHTVVKKTIRNMGVIIDMLKINEAIKIKTVPIVEAMMISRISCWRFEKRFDLYN